MPFHFPRLSGRRRFERDMEREMRLHMVVIAGVTAGFLGAFALSRVLSTLLYNVSPHDALVFFVAPLIIFIAGAFSCWLPARRAANVDPAIALRWE